MSLEQSPKAAINGFFSDLERLSPSLSPKTRKALERAIQEIKRRQVQERVRGWVPLEPPYNDQLGFLLSEAKVRLASGGNRVGKSECEIKDADMTCRGIHPVWSKKFKPPVVGWFVCPTFEDGVALILLKMQKFLRRDQLFGHSWETAYDASTHTLTYALDGQKDVPGSQIRFKTARQGLNTYGGQDLHFACVDEHVPVQYHREIMARLVDHDGYMVKAMTPELGMTWEMREIVLRAKEGDSNFATWQWDMRLNPYLDAKGVAEFIKALEDDPQAFDVKVRGLFVALSGLIFPMFNEQIHTYADDYDIVRNAVHRQIILDAHLQTPWATVWIAWTKDNRPFVYREFKWTPVKGGIEDYATHVRAMSLGEKIHDYLLDPAMGGAPKDEKVNAFGVKDVVTQLNDNNLPFVGVPMEKKDVEARIMTERAFLRIDPATGFPKLRIAISCPETIRQHGVYQFKRPKPGDDEDLRERIRKIDDHFVDAVGMGLACRPDSGPIAPVTRYDIQRDEESGEPIVRPAGARRPAGTPFNINYDLE